MSGTNLGTAYVQIVPSAQGIKGSIANVLDPEAQAAGASAGSKIGAFAKKAIATAAIGTTVVAGVKAAMAEGAKLQQSYIGGVETLYGEAADAVREHAKAAAAYGISMNDYSEQAVSFGAALKKAYGNDALKAAKAADVAIQDMADNSAKMGTDIASVQMAYQGFARGQYQLLDNLKLGYGGTRGEMERLLADAEEFSGVHYDIDNLGDVYEAIHVIQGELGLTGVAAGEAADTFSGSFNAMKAAAQNLLGSLAIGENVGPAMEQLASSVSTFFFGNFIPMLGTIVKSLPSAIVAFLRQGLPLLVSGISSLMTNLTAYISGIANGLTGETVSTWVSANVPKILAAGGKLIAKLATSFIINLPKIVAAIGRIGIAIITGLGSAIWPKVTAAAAGIRDRFMKPINAMRDKVKAVIDKVKGFFPIKVGNLLSGLKLPHLSISGKLSLNPPSVPKLSVKWFAKGGIIDGATILGGVGLGEAGPEAIVPLDPFWKKLDSIAKEANSNNVFNFYIDGRDKSAKEIAYEVRDIIIKETNQRRLVWQ